MNSYLITSTKKSSGKSIITIGLTAVLNSMKYKLSVFKKGPDYIDMSWLALASKRNSYNLDFNTQSKSEIKSFFNKKKAKINLVEGNNLDQTAMSQNF